MNKREEFEQSLRRLTEISNDEPEVIEEIKLALERLKGNPALFCGNPDGDFIYEDPILANALYFYLESEEIPIVTANSNQKSVRRSRWGAWAVAGIKACINSGSQSFRELQERIPTESIKIKKDELHLAVVGDGGYKGDIQSNVLNKIKERHSKEPFDLLIHLGDIYFAGGNSAVLKHFLAPFREVGPDVLALLGNHELYMGGESFCLVLDVLRQPGRYFSIENDNWCIVCLDTSLPARHLLRNEGELDPDQIEWVNNLIQRSSNKGIIFMSHHYVVSGWGDISPTLEMQLKPMFPNIFSWYWGHEHGCATYDKQSVGFYGACIGNGAFLEKWKTPTFPAIPDWYARGRCNCIETNSHYWQHGYLELKIKPNEILEYYHLEDECKHRKLNRNL